MLGTNSPRQGCLYSHDDNLHDSRGIQYGSQLLVLECTVFSPLHTCTADMSATAWQHMLMPMDSLSEGPVRRVGLRGLHLLENRLQLVWRDAIWIAALEQMCRHLLDPLFVVWNNRSLVSVYPQRCTKRCVRCDVVACHLYKQLNYEIR